MDARGGGAAGTGSVGGLWWGGLWWGGLWWSDGAWGYLARLTGRMAKAATSTMATAAIHTIW